MIERQDSKQAEKTYLGRTGGSAWEREKPFSPPGDDTLDDSLALLHDFAVAARLLEPSPHDRIVDLGAGGGWCSDLLQRLNRKSIELDASDKYDAGELAPHTDARVIVIAADMASSLSKKM